MPTPSSLVSGADTAWMLISCALVLLMTPALAFFYGGLVRSKNALNTMMMSVAPLGVIGLLWAVAGYSLAFGQGNAVVGGLGHLLLRGVGVEAHGTIPHVLFMAYQGTFAVITAALISGAVVERMRCGPYLTFIAASSLLAHAPVSHRVSGGGSLATLAPLDLARRTARGDGGGPAHRRPRHRGLGWGGRPDRRTSGSGGQAGGGGAGHGPLQRRRLVRAAEADRRLRAVARREAARGARSRRGDARRGGLHERRGGDPGAPRSAGAPAARRGRAGPRGR